MHPIEYAILTEAVDRIFMTAGPILNDDDPAFEDACEIVARGGKGKLARLARICLGHDRRPGDDEPFITMVADLTAPIKPGDRRMALDLNENDSDAIMERISEFLTRE